MSALPEYETTESKRRKAEFDLDLLKKAVGEEEQLCNDLKNAVREREEFLTKFEMAKRAFSYLLQEQVIAFERINSESYMEILRAEIDAFKEREKRDKDGKAT